MMLRLLTGLMVVVLVSSPLSAQAVRGTVVEPAGGGVPGVLVVLVDSSGRQYGRALTDGGGAYLLEAPAAGRYRVRAERVGVRTVLSSAVDLGAGETLPLHLVLPSQPVVLEGLTVQQGRRRCSTRPQEATALMSLWEEARKALNNVVWASSPRVYRYEAVSYHRDLDPSSLQVRSEQRTSAAVTAQHPFAGIPVEDLARYGYRRDTPEGTFYYAPDAVVLLSDAFLEDHCFSIREGAGEEAGLIGMAFEPTRARGVPEVEGVFWLDRESAELRHLEYRYTHLGLRVPSEKLGGRVEFDRLPSGAWIVKRWWIRMPMLEVQQSSRTAHDASGIEQREQERLVGIREQGGEITGVHTLSGAPVTAVRRASVAGVVYDSTRAAPLAGATVFISGTRFSATTDDAGRFRLDGLPEGEYAVSFHHPRLDSLGVAVTPRSISVDGQELPQLEMAVPSVRLASRATTAPAAADTAGAVRLAGIRATGRPQNPAAAAFYQRAERGDGRFITREEIERRKPSHTAELFRTIPSFEVVGQTVRVRMSGAPAPGGLSRFPMRVDGGRDISSTKTTEGANAITAGTNAEKLTERDRPSDCTPSIFLDGKPWEPMGGDLGAIRPGDIEGIEAYPRSALAPAQYRRQNSDCGIILIWLRQGGQ